MNRSLMGRQMFAKGGAAFPDYSGDGEITQKDILMGRGVIPRTMQEGGMVDPMMMQEPAPQGGEVDPDVLAGMFGQIEGQIQGLDQAEDIEGMMNAVRGDQQPIEARRAELAELVGPEDAQETPDSVLALVQPIMQLASVDQGIGGLAADSMGDIAMEGPMAEGIMSTVNTAPPTDQAMMAPPMDPAMMGVGNEPPVNFRYGGAVQYMQAGGPPGAASVSPIQTAFDQRKDLYRSIIGDDTVEDQAMLDERRDLTKSQMLFDIANTALAFSTPGSRQMSPAQRLAEAARETQLLDKFGARTGAIQDLKDKQALASRSANRSLDMAALASAEKDVSDTLAAEAAIRKAQIASGEKGNVNIMIPGMKRSLRSVRKIDVPTYSSLGYALATSVSSSGDDSKRANFKKPSGEIVTAEVGTALYNQYLNVDKFPETGPAKQSSASELAAQIQNFAMIGDPTQVMRLDLSDATDLATLKSLDPKKWVKAGSQTLTPDKGPELTDRQRILADPELQEKYGNGTASALEVNRFETAIAAEYGAKETKNIDGSVSLKTPIVLASVADAYRARKRGDSKTSSSLAEIFPNPPTALDDVRDLNDLNETLTSSTTREELIIGRENLNNKMTAIAADYLAVKGFEDGSLPQPIRDSEGFKKLLLKADGSVELASPLWRMIPTTIFEKEVQYGQARGIGSIPTRLVTNFSELFREAGGVFGVDRLNEDGLNIYQADSDMKTLQLQTMNVLTDAATGGEQRVLKSVQDAVSKILDPLASGAFSLDAKALPAIRSIKKNLGVALQATTPDVPSFGGNRNTRTSKSTKNSRQLVKLIAEYTALEDHISTYLKLYGSNQNLKTDTGQARKGLEQQIQIGKSGLGFTEGTN